MDFFEKLGRMLWRAWLIIGIITVVFGIAAVAWPDGTVEVITRLFAVAIILGAIGIAGLSWLTKGVSPVWGVGIFFAVIGLIIGISALANPGTFSIVLAVIFGLVALFSGIGNVGAGGVSAVAGVGWPILLSGVVQIILGVMLLASPFTSLLAVTWAVGTIAIILGATMLVSGLLIRKTLRAAGEEVGLLSKS